MLHLSLPGNFESSIYVHIASVHIKASHYVVMDSRLFALCPALMHSLTSDQTQKPF